MSFGTQFLFLKWEVLSTIVEQAYSGLQALFYLSNTWKGFFLSLTIHIYQLTFVLIFSLREPGLPAPLPNAWDGVKAEQTRMDSKQAIG